jgi:hypothetical protein
MFRILPTTAEPAICFTRSNFYQLLVLKLFFIALNMGELVRRNWKDIASRYIITKEKYLSGGGFPTSFRQEEATS